MVISMRHSTVHFGSAIGSFLMQAASLKKRPVLYEYYFYSFHSVCLAAPLRLLLAYLCHSQECDASALVTLATLATLRVHKYEVRQQCRVRDLLTCLLPARSCVTVASWLKDTHTHTHMDTDTHTSVDRQAYKQTAVKAAQLTVLLHKFCGGC